MPKLPRLEDFARHSPGTPGRCFPGAPDTIRPCDRRLKEGTASSNRAPTGPRKAVADLKSKGMTIVENVDKAKFQAALGPTFTEFGKKFGQENIDKIRNYK